MKVTNAVLCSLNLARICSGDAQKLDDEKAGLIGDNERNLLINYRRLLEGRGVCDAIWCDSNVCDTICGAVCDTVCDGICDRVCDRICGSVCDRFK